MHRHTIHTGQTPYEKGAVGVNLLTVHQLLQSRNSLHALCKMCNNNSSRKVALCSLLGTLSVLWMAAAWVWCQSVMTKYDLHSVNSTWCAGFLFNIVSVCYFWLYRAGVWFIIRPVRGWCGYTAVTATSVLGHFGPETNLYIQFNCWLFRSSVNSVTHKDRNDLATLVLRKPKLSQYICKVCCMFIIMPKSAVCWISYITQNSFTDILLRRNT